MHKKVLGDLRRRRIDICLVWALDRLTREGIARIFELINRFKQYGVQVISYQESWTEQSGPMADLLDAVTTWVAEFESRRRSERTKAGLARAIASGKKLGRPKGSRDKTGVRVLATCCGMLVWSYAGNTANKGAAKNSGRFWLYQAES